VNNITQLVKELQEAGVIFTANSTGIRVRSPRAMPNSLRTALGAQKCELREHFMRTAPARMNDALERHGFVVVRSSVLDDDILVVATPNRSIPSKLAHLVRYHLGELERLTKSACSDLQLIHDVKMLFGGEVID